jgi:hypothetical protein
MKTERRQFERVSFISSLSINDGQHQSVAQVLDLSLKGIHFSKPDNCQISLDNQIEIVLHLDSDHDIFMNVSLIRQTQHGFSGYWNEIDGESFTRLKRLLVLNLGSEELIEREVKDLL